MDNSQVYSMLSESGFYNIDYEIIEDLTVDEINQDFIVTKVSFNNQSNFNKDTKYKNDSNIIIQYHTLKEIPIPLSSEDIIGRDYIEINKKLKEAGFINIQNIPLNDLILGWINKKNEIETITIDGIEEFSRDYRCRPDASIIIEYHSFD